MLFVKFNTGLEVYYDLLMMLDLFTQSTEYSANAIAYAMSVLGCYTPYYLKRAAQTNRIKESKGAAKILNLGGFEGERVQSIDGDDRRRLEAQQNIKRKREEKLEKRKKQKLEQEAKEKAKKEWAEKVKHITPLLVAAGKTREGKASSFAQIRDFLKKKHKPNKTEFATWTSENILEKWNNYEA